MTQKRNRPLVTATASVAALSMLAAYGTRPLLVDYRPVVDSYNTNMATRIWRPMKATGHNV